MSAPFVRIVFVIWLGWYLAGPLAETFDFWDTPQEEMADLASSVDGALVWAAAAICLAILVSRQFCKCCSYLAEAGLLDLLQPNSYSTCRIVMKLRLRGRSRRRPKQVHHQQTMRDRPF